MTKLSVNINKWATLRNARGGNNPDLLKTALAIQEMGADGITVHPRPDERHIRYEDVFQLRPLIHTEFNIEGNPREQKFIELVLQNKPDQVTLVPDAEGQLTSDHGWDTIMHQGYLKGVIRTFQEAGIRVSIFLDPNPEMIASAAETETDRIELYTEFYAKQFHQDAESAIHPYLLTAETARRHGLKMNAGHDLDLKNLAYFSKQIPDLCEVSIGHALICDAIEFGLHNTVQMYKRSLV
jgi:pyridoxine 5-phosphate synthase